MAINQLTIEVSRGLKGDAGDTGSPGLPGSDASVTNANVNAAIAEDTGATRTALELGTSATMNTGTTNGTIPLIGFGDKLAASLLPSFAITDFLLVANQAERLALSDDVYGKIVKQADNGRSYGLPTGNEAGDASEWLELGDSLITAADIQDPENLPVSTAQQAAIDAETAARNSDTPDGIESEFIPLNIPTPDGLPSVTHPSAVDIGTTWNGYRYWMAFTPWPNGARELPCVVASNNLVDWVVPDGASNPISTVSQINIAAGASLYSYLADTHMIFKDGSLWLYYKAHADSPAREGLVLQKSTDGTTWSTPQFLIQHGDSVTRLISPAVAVKGATSYLFVIDRYTGGLSEHQKLRYHTSSDGLAWTGPTTCILPEICGLGPWHLDVQFSGGLFHALITSTTSISTSANSYYFTSADALNWTGSPIPGLNRLGSYDGNRIYRTGMIPCDEGRRWHIFVGGVPKNAIAETGDINAWRIGLRRGFSFAERNAVFPVEQRITDNSFYLRWSSGHFIPAGKSYDISDTSTRMIESWSGAQALVTIWGMIGSTAAGGIWACGTFTAVKMSTGPTNATFAGSVTPYLSLSALPNNSTPTSGQVVTGSTSGATAVFHRIRNSSPAQYSLRQFAGSTLFQVGEQIQVDGVTATSGGTPVTISALNFFPAASALNLIYVDNIAGYAGRFQLWNSSASTATCSLEIKSNRF